MKRELYAILLLSEVDEMPILPLIRGKIILRRYTDSEISVLIFNLFSILCITGMVSK